VTDWCRANAEYPTLIYISNDSQASSIVVHLTASSFMMGTGTVIIVLFIIVVLYYGRKVGSRPKDYPPGPPTLPFIGNLHLMPKEQPHLQFKKWADEYGPIYSLVIGTNTLIVVSSGTIVKDLLDKRSAIYSSRPSLYVGQQLLSRGLRMLLMVSTLVPVGTNNC
jgi:hypothetical protein